MFTLGSIGAVLGGLSLGLPMLGFLTKLKPFRKLIFIGAIVLAVIAAGLFGLAKLKAYGNERYMAGQAERQAAWDKAAADAALARAAELRRASEDLSMRDLTQMKVEESDDARNEKLNFDLKRELAIERAGLNCTIPGQLLAPRRALNPRAP